MNYKRIGKTDIIASRIGLGCLHFDCADNPESIVKNALDLGINYIDTARIYGYSEGIIGKAIIGRRDECYIASKSIRRSEVDAHDEIETSLNNLRTDMIDIYFCHSVSREYTYNRVIDGSLIALQKAKESGKIRYIGISTHDSDTAIKAIDSGYFDVILIPVNIFDLDLVTKVIPVAREYNIGLIGMKAMAGGAFIHPDIAIRFSLAQDTDMQLIGVKSVDELMQDIAVAGNFDGLSENDSVNLFEEAKRLGTDFCRQCGYCMPCSAGIDIPKIFLYEREAKRYYAEDFSKQRYMVLDKDASDCTKCGKCESRCPYNLPIRNKLQAIHKLLRGDAVC